MKTIKTLKITAISICLIFNMSSCMKEESLNLPYQGFAPEFTGDGWEISSPEAEQMDHEIVNDLYIDFFNEERYPNIRSLLVIRNGKLVSEAYCKNAEHRDQLHNIMSVTKSITSMLTGIALGKGYISSIDSTVYSYMPEYFDQNENKRKITLKDVLTMETGLYFDNDIHTNELISRKGSSLKYVLQKDLLFNPGTDWFYGDGNPQIISGIIQSVSGISEAKFAEKYLFNPLGIHNYFWNSHNDGLTFGAIGLWLTPRDMAKIGWLMACKGNWNGSTLLSEEWITESTKRQSRYHNYGYYWYPIDNLGFYAEGHGGQLIWVYPVKNLVVVITSDSYSKTFKLSSGYEDLFNKIILSLKD